MHGFWGDVFGRWASLFETHYKKAKFWAGVVGTIAVAIATGIATVQLDQFKRYWWVSLVPILLYAGYSFRLAVEEHYEALEKKYIELGDKLTAERQARRPANNANGAEGSQKPASEHVSVLGAFAVEGVALRRQINKSAEWTDDLNNAYRSWNKKVDDYVSEQVPDLLSVLRHIPECPTIKVSARKYHQRSVHDLDHKVSNLHAIMERVEGRA